MYADVNFLPRLPCPLLPDPAKRFETCQAIAVPHMEKGIVGSYTITISTRYTQFSESPGLMITLTLRPNVLLSRLWVLAASFYIPCHSPSLATKRKRLSGSGNTGAITLDPSKPTALNPYTANFVPLASFPASASSLFAGAGSSA